MTTSPEMRGRVMALYMAIFMGGTPIGAPLLGWIAEHFGARWTLVGGGALTAIGTIASTAWLARRQGVRITPHLRPRPGLTIGAIETADIAAAA
jgi:MFS family permease